jgi:hypothetical protein
MCNLLVIDGVLIIQKKAFKIDEIIYFEIDKYNRSESHGRSMGVELIIITKSAETHKIIFNDEYFQISNSSQYDLNKNQKMEEQNNIEKKIIKIFEENLPNIANGVKQVMTGLELSMQG